MTRRTPATIDRLAGDQALVTTPDGTERYRAADIAITLGTSLDRLPGTRLTARRDRHGRLYDWAPDISENR